MLKHFVILLMLLTGSAIYAAPVGGQGSYLHLEEATSAGHSSMGSAGYTSDVGQMFYNPSYLFGGIRGRNFSFTYQTNSDSFSQNYAFLGYAWPGDSSKFALGVAYLGTSNLQSFDSSGNFNENYSTSEFLTGGSHIWRLTDKITFGETLKVYYFNYKFASATAGALDLGMHYQILPFFGIGVSLDNLVATNVTFATESESLPVIFRVQPTIEFLRGRARIHYEFGYFTGLFEDSTAPPEHKVGLEFDIYKKYLQARAGYNGQDVSMGIGSQVQPYRTSFAVTPTPFETRYALTLSFDIDTGGVGPFARPKVAAKSDAEQELSDFYEGMERYASGEFKEAFDKFTDVLRTNPDHKLAADYRDRALLHLKVQDNWLDAEQQKLIRLHKELARKYEAEKNYGEAISEWRQVLGINPADKEAPPNIERIKALVQNQVITYHRRGLSAYGANDRLTAISAFNEALKLNPEYEPSKNWLFKIKQEISQEELREIERIEKLQKAEVLYNKGLSFYSKQQYQAAVTQFDACLLLNPKHEKAKRYKKLALEDWELAKKGLKGKRAAEALYKKGMKNYDQEKYYYAMRDFDRSLRALPTYKPAAQMKEKSEKKLAQQVRPHLKAGKSAYRKKRFSKALTSFTVVMKLHPDHPEAREYLEKLEKDKEANIRFNLSEGTKFYNQGKKGGGLKAYSKSIVHLNEVVVLANPEDKGNKKYSAEYRRAKSLLAKAQKKVKAQTDKLHGEAMVLFRKEKYDSAIEKWEAVLKIDAANALAARYIQEAQAKKRATDSAQAIASFNREGIALYQNRDFAQALALFNDALKLDKKDKTALKYKALCKKEMAGAKTADKVSALFIEGVRDYKKKKYKSAIKKWKKVKRLDPSNVLVDKYIKQARQAQKDRKRIDYIRGLEHYKNGRWLLAKSSFKEALKEDPSNQKARQKLEETRERIAEERQQFVSEGDALMRKGKYQEASTTYMNALRLDKSADIEEKRDNAIEARNKFEEGERYYSSENQVLSIGPFLRVLEINPFDKRASERIQKAKESGSRNIDKYMAQAQAAEDKKDWQRAFGLYKSVREIDAGHKEAGKGMRRTRNQLRKLAAVPYEEGKELMGFKNYKSAISKFKETLSIMNPYEDTADLLKTARKKKAEAARRRAAAAASGGGKPTAASSGDLKTISAGIKLYRQGKYKAAIATWKRIPKSSAAYGKAQKYIARAKLKL